MTLIKELSGGADQFARVIAESNRLIREGFLQGASELLEEAMERFVTNVQLIRAVAHVRMLQGRPAEAVPLLKQALRILQGGESLEKLPPEPVPAAEVPPLQAANPEPVRHATVREQAASPDPQTHESDFDYAARVEREIVSLRDVDPDLQDQLDGHRDAVLELLPDVQSLLLGEDESTQVDLEQHQDLPDFRREALEIIREVYLDGDGPPDRPIDVDELIALFDDSGSGEEIEEEGPFDAEIPTVPPVRDYDPSLDDFGVASEGEAPTREELQSLPPRITREQRGRQIAQKLADDYGWDRAGVDLLTAIFVKHWWSSAQTAMRRLLEAGITLRELRLADQVRELWFSYQEFAEYIDYWGNKTQRYRTLPWTTTFDLVRAYDGYPDVEEIETYLFDAYQTWCGLEHLHRRFPAYYDFLRHILDNHEAGDMLPPAATFA